MANYWVITIGINQYRHVQPLMHAQNDALFIHRFFTEEAGIASNHCVLLSDLTTSVGSQVVYPDKPAIAQWLQTITQQVSPGDVLWFFFSGYGTQLEGADYLMPIDGDLDQIEETGIAAADLIDTLAQLPTDKAVLVLDINRSQGALAGHRIGQQVIELAQKRQVATLLSCEPEQYSHETLGVRHGLFTAALLEALQQGSSTLGQIRDYLTKRLPELCEHHWRPVQNAVVLMSDEQKIATVVPELVTSINSVTSAVSTANAAALESAVTDTSASESALREPAVVGMGAGAIAGGAQIGERPYTEVSARTDSYRSQNRVEEGDDFGRATTSALATTEPNSSALVPISHDKEPSRTAINGAKLRNWGLLALAVLMGLVLLKQPFVKTAWSGLIDKLELATGWGPGTDAEDAETPETEAVVDAQTDPSEPVSEGDATVGNVAANPDGLESEDAQAATATGAATETAAEDSSLENQENSDSENSNSENSNSENSESPEDKATAAALIAQATAALEKNQYSEALIALRDVPKGQRDSKFSDILIKARAGAAEAQQNNASLLTDARTAIQPTQASQFTEAIAKAKLIQPGEPYYDEAQKDIRGWSQIILDIAEGRATSGNLQGAIAAAKVMPREDANSYQKAQDRIAFWQQRQQSREMIEVAKTIPKSGQASTYQKGIVKLREVPIEHPEYETAQRLADQWSDRIFSIAQARAAQGRQEAAIQAAILVPAGTTSYEPTQQAIRRWRTEAQENKQN